MAGAFYILPPERVHPVDVPFAVALKVFSEWDGGEFARGCKRQSRRRPHRPINPTANFRSGVGAPAETWRPPGGPQTGSHFCPRGMAGRRHEDERPLRELRSPACLLADFAVLILDAKFAGNGTILLAADWTVLLSVIAHCVTANPLVMRMAARRSGEVEAGTDAAN